jgi:dienelactone hydrolase
MHTEVISYEADGLLMQSHLYIGDGQPRRPGILVFPEAFGLSQHAKTQAQRLAELGYIALACDLHGEGKLFADLKSVSPILESLRSEPSHIRARAKGGLDALVARPEVDASRVAAIGFCFGGTMALELARGGNPVVGVVGFHSGLATVAPKDAHNIKGKVLVCIGADDPVIPLGQRIDFESEMRNGGVDWQMDVYGGVMHSFTNPGADKSGLTHIARYNAQAAARSWATMRAFFEEIFGETE